MKLNGRDLINIGIYGALIFCTILRRDSDTLCGDHHDGGVCYRNYIGQ